ncbi:MAG: hypothetical protein ACFFDH_08585 [Promethearchaeota archaeon]
MTEEQSEEIEAEEEKEEKRKIKVISEIDDKIAIQGQAYMKGKLNEALSLAYEIIELAEPEDLRSFIREQEILIDRITKILKEREEKEKERIRAEQERLRLEKIKKSKLKLSQLEREFNIALKIDNFEKIEVILETAKNLISDFDDEKIKIKWEKYKNNALKSKIRKDLIEKSEKLIEESIALKEKYLFEDLKQKLCEIKKELEENEITDYLKEIRAIENDAINAEKHYQKTLRKIDQLINDVKNSQDIKKYKDAVKDCKEIIQLAESIKKNEIAEEYSKLFKILQEQLKFKELKDSITKLNDEGLKLLREGNIIASLEKFKTIYSYLKEYKN